jgi:hypothetical protein
MAERQQFQPGDVVQLKSESALGVWHCLDCGGQWPRKPAAKAQEG